MGAEGKRYWLDVRKGCVGWSMVFKKDYVATTLRWGYGGHPLVDGRRVFCLVGGKGSVAVAFDKDTGKELWKSLSGEDDLFHLGYSPPTLIEAGGKTQLVIWHGESINGLDPETGNPYWSVPLVASVGMAIAAPRRLGDHLLASGAGASVLLRLMSDKPAVKEVWRDKLFSVNVTPFLEGGMIYGVDHLGHLCGVK